MNRSPHCADTPVLVTEGVAAVEFLVFGALILWLMPWLIAVSGSHPRHGAILALTLLLGWTGVGWIVGLFWAWPTRTGSVSLHIVPDPAPARRLPASDRRRGTARLRLRSALGVCAWVGLTAVGGVTATRFAFSPAFSPYRATLPTRIESLRAGPGPDHREVGVLHAPCVVRVVAEDREWKHVWKTGDCDAQSSGRSEGWVRWERSSLLPWSS